MSEGGGDRKSESKIGCGKLSTPDSSKKEKGKARDKAGEKVGVSGKSIAQAAKLQEASPELFERVKSGELTLNAATKQAFPSKSKSSKKVDVTKQHYCPWLTFKSLTILVCL